MNGLKRPQGSDNWAAAVSGVRSQPAPSLVPRDKMWVLWVWGAPAAGRPAVAAPQHIHDAQVGIGEQAWKCFLGQLLVSCRALRQAWSGFGWNFREPRKTYKRKRALHKILFVYLFICNNPVSSFAGDKICPCWTRNYVSQKEYFYDYIFTESSQAKIHKPELNTLKYEDKGVQVRL